MNAEPPLVARLFARLADGQFRSGEALASELHVSRSAIWKCVRRLRDLGARVDAVPKRGYRLVPAAHALSPAAIRQQLSPDVRTRVRRLEVLWSVGSTNSVLMERANPPPGQCEVLLAEHQTAGRGRRGRAWFAPPGGSICLSLSWTFREMPRDLGSLGLVMGVCALRALGRATGGQLRLKWPNDLLVAGRKLGGVLIELRAESSGPACVVIGIGVNVALGTALPEKIAREGLPPTDLVSAGWNDPARNVIAAGLVDSFVRGLIEFESLGLKPFVPEWMEADALRGRPVTVHAAEEYSHGVARGIDLDGALLVETSNGLQRFISGDVSVRVVA